MDKRSLEKFRNQYEEAAPAVERCCADLKYQLEQLLDVAGVRLAFPVEARVKQWASVEAKLDSVPISIRRITDMQDLAGLRIVVLFARDAARVCEILEQHLKVVRRYESRNRQREDQFGYSSHHLIVQLPAEHHTALSTTLKAEVQVRTLAQHLWAAASHILQYKQEESVPPDVQRSVHRVSALLETVDLEFERVLADRERYRATLTPGKSDEELNVDSLEAELALCWPPDNKVGNEPYDLLLAALRKFGIHTTEQLRAFVAKWREPTLVRAAREAERLRSAEEAYGVRDGRITIVKQNKHSTIHVTEDVLRRARSGVFYSHTGLTFTALQFERGSRKPDEPME